MIEELFTWVFFGGLFSCAALTVIGCLIPIGDPAARFVDKCLPYAIGTAIVGAVGLFWTGVNIY